MMKKFFLVLGLALCYPISYQSALTNEVVLSAEDSTNHNIDNDVITNENEPMEQESGKKSSKNARARKIGRVIGFIVLAIVALGVAAVTFIFGFLGYVSLAIQMGWITIK